MIVAYVLIGKPLRVVWDAWQNPAAMPLWLTPDRQWKCVQMENDVKKGGRYCISLEDESGATQSYSGQYTSLIPFESLAFVEDDGISGIIEFQQIDDNTIVRKTCEFLLPALEQELYLGCQTMLDHFKKFVEENE